MPKHIDRLPSYREASVGAYATGLTLSLALTVAAFVLVAAYRSTDGAMFSRGVLIAFLAVLAVIQMTVQILFFLHLSAERRLRMNRLAVAFTVFVVLCIVVGSIWIMQNLNYNMMPEHPTEQAQKEEGIYR